MDIEFELTQDDVVAARMQILKHLLNKKRGWKWIPYMWKWTPYMMFFLGIALIAIGIFRSNSWKLGHFGTFYMYFFGAVLIIYAFLLPRLFSNAQKRGVKAINKGPNTLVGKHKVSVSQEAIKDTTSVGESSTNWAAISEVITTEHYLMILARGTNAYVIPRRAIPSADAFNQLAERAKAYQRAAEVTS